MAAMCSEYLHLTFLCQLSIVSLPFKNIRNLIIDKRQHMNLTFNSILV